MFKVDMIEALPVVLGTRIPYFAGAASNGSIQQPIALAFLSLSFDLSPLTSSKLGNSLGSPMCVISLM